MCGTHGLIILRFPLTGEQVVQVQYKAYESGSRQVDGKYCGDQIRPRFDQLCSGRKRRRSKLTAVAIFTVNFSTSII